LPKKKEKNGGKKREKNGKKWRKMVFFFAFAHFSARFLDFIQ